MRISSITLNKNGTMAAYLSINTKTIAFKSFTQRNKTILSFPKRINFYFFNEFFFLFHEDKQSLQNFVHTSIYIYFFFFEDLKILHARLIFDHT